MRADMEQVSKNQKSMLAKLLATENITVQHQPNARTAWFDVKNRVLCLPVWREMSNDLYDMLVIHEVGHALDTPAEGFLEALEGIAGRVTGSNSNRVKAAVKGFLNVVEDARIDKRQKRRFPGSRRNYIKGYAELIERDFFGTAKRDINTMSFIDRANIFFKGGAMLGIQFSPEERKFLKRMEDAETFDEVLKLTEEIFAYAKDKNDQTQELDPDDFDTEYSDEEGSDFDDFDDFEESEDESEGSGSKGKPEDGDEESDEDSETSGEGDDGDEGEEEASSDKDDNEAGDEAGDDDRTDGALKQNGDEDIPESETDKAWEKKQEELVLNSDLEYRYVNLPVANHAKIVDDYKLVLAQQSEALKRFTDAEWRSVIIEELNKFKAEENATVSYMVKEFEMRKAADEYQRTAIAKTGVIDTNKLHSYKYNDDIFRRIATVSAGKNHGFVMFLDWSGSMDVNLKKTMKQLFSLVMFCKRVQIPFEVYTFRCITSSDGQTPANEYFSKGKDELDFDPLKLRNILSSRMRLDELNNAMNNLFMLANRAHIHCDSLGSTPLNEAILAADEVINQFRIRNKVQIVNTIFLTDGESDPTYMSSDDRNFTMKKRKYIIQDNVTKKTYDVVPRYAQKETYSFDADGRWMTATLLKILKERTNCNLVGFFIHASGFKGAYHDFYGYTSTYQHQEATKKMWNDDGFFPVTTSGYDEYYILNGRAMNIVNENLSVSSDMTKTKIAKEFMKFSERKSVNRVLLRRFISKIAA